MTSAFPDEIDTEQRASLYPGSSIGNLSPRPCRRPRLANIRRQCADGALIIGVDLVKAREILEPRL